MYRIGIDLGGTNIAAGLVDPNDQIVERVTVKTGLLQDPVRLADDLAGLARSLMERRSLRPEDVMRIGVGVPCTAIEETGHMEDPCRPGLEDVPLAQMLEQRLHLPVCIGNDANAAAWGEYCTGGYAEDSFLMLTIGTGIGGGIILNGRLWTGLNGAAGEFGHMVLYREGLPCSCGRRGCFESYGSATALIRQARQYMAGDRHTLLWRLCGGDPEQVEAKSVFDGAQAGDAGCLALLDRYTTDLAEGAANLINIFQPAVLCIGGGVSRAGDLLLEPLKKKTAGRIYTKNSKRNTQIVLAKLDNDAGVIGAALLGENGRNVR